MIAITASALDALRAEVDGIDDQILSLIEQRIAISAAIASQKNSVRNRFLKFCPRRRAAVVSRLQKRAVVVPPHLISAVWSELMGHALQAQARTEVVLCGVGDRSMSEQYVRAHFGAAVPIRWVASIEDALCLARTNEAIAVLSEPLKDLSLPLRVCDAVAAIDGKVICWAIGRVAVDDCADVAKLADPYIPAGGRASGWSPESWRLHPAKQMPSYPDPKALAEAEHSLHLSSPLVQIPDIVLLRARLSQVASGRAFLLQGGDCAEVFSKFSADKVQSICRLFREMEAMISATGGTTVVQVARIAGQFAKPRSNDSETIDGVAMPSYRGDAVNGAAPNFHSRTPDPRRLVEAHRQAQATIDLLRVYSTAFHADVPLAHPASGLSEPVRAISMFTSHEALLLNYEQALTRYDERTERWWATSGHMIWIGDRTRALDGAHVEFTRGVANPIGLKCGPSLEDDELVRLMDRIDPHNQAGRLVLIGRFGADKVERHLPPLIRACSREGRAPVWSIDPMHGNTRTIGRYKTRDLGDVQKEIVTFFDICRAEGIQPGGVHLEMTGSKVTECLGGTHEVREADLSRHYLTHCDPRLNGDQARDIAALLGQLLEKGPAAELIQLEPPAQKACH